MHPDAHMTFFQQEGPSEPEVVHAIMTQLSLKVGLKRWGEKAQDAARSEMKQLHMRNTLESLLWKNLDDNQKKTVLESHMLFLKEKRDGKNKGCTVAGGNKQRDFISKEDASSSPTVTTKAVLLTALYCSSMQRNVEMSQLLTSQTRLFRPALRTKLT
jgi:hypothetical protein